MIISQTPLRISFVGGGSDLKDFYSITSGKVVSTAIDKYIYITINKRFDDTIRVSYSITEIVENVEDIRHPIIREALKKTGIIKGIEITSIADIPAKTGLGSSSSFTVGLLNALYAYKGEYKSAEYLANEACNIEIDILKEPIGKQDQYIAAYGGLKFIEFNSDETVFIEPIICNPEKKKKLNDNLLLFYTGITRNASEILKDQKKETGNKYNIIKQMVDLTSEFKKNFSAFDNLNEFGKILDKAWQFKKKLTVQISNSDIDLFYDKAKKAGAIGGKILGAGGGGFLLLYVEPKYQKNVINAMKPLKNISFKFEIQGTKIIFIGG